MPYNLTTAIRICELRNKLNLSQRDFANRIGITQGALSQLENNKSTLSLSTIVSISDEFNVDCNWLIIGDTDNFQRNPEHRTDGNLAISKHYLPQNINLIPLIKEEAHAGYIDQSEDINFISTLDVYRIPGFESGDYRMFEIEGDSMLPAIQPREIVITERVSDWVALENGIVCVLITRDGIVAKRVYRYQENEDNLILKSDNPNYKTYSVPQVEVIEIWEFKAKITNVLNSEAITSQDRFKSIESDILALKSQLDGITKI